MRDSTNVMRTTLLAERGAMRPGPNDEEQRVSLLGLLAHSCVSSTEAGFRRLRWPRGIAQAFWAVMGATWRGDAGTDRNYVSCRVAAVILLQEGRGTDADGLQFAHVLRGWRLHSSFSASGTQGGVAILRSPSFARTQFRMRRCSRFWQGALLYFIVGCG